MTVRQYVKEKKYFIINSKLDRIMIGPYTGNVPERISKQIIREATQKEIEIYFNL